MTLCLCLCLCIRVLIVVCAFCVDMAQLVYVSLPVAPVCWCRCWRITEAQLQMLMVANWLQTFGLGIWPNDLYDLSHM